MNAAIAARALPRWLLGVTILCVACSDEPKTGAPLQVGQSAVSHIQSALVSAGATAPLAPVAPYAVAISVQPWTYCNVYPEGISNDPTRNANVTADADGNIRFYPPPASWGTNLTLACTLNGSSQGTVTINLSDPTTFTQEPLASLAPTVATVVPALTGDLTTISQAELLQGGYPPRPDPAQTQQYAVWEKMVTQPFDAYPGVGVFDLALQGSGTYDGYTISRGTLGDSAIWAGFVQSANGFTSGVANAGITYDQYNSLIYAPPDNSCSSPPCLTLLWTGIGGFP
ncbi:MAG: hypothetical protein ACLP1X_29170, partial [Polyangiaceae bacterium]